jgi:hypothetical protein
VRSEAALIPRAAALLAQEATMALSPAERDSAARLRRVFLADLASMQALSDQEIRSVNGRTPNPCWTIAKEYFVEQAAKIRAATDEEILDPRLL